MMLGETMEYTTSTGRKVKLTERLKQHLETERSLAVARERRKVAKAVQRLQTKITDSTVEPIDVQREFKEAISAQSTLLDMETDEKKELDPIEVPMYESYFEEDNTIIDSGSQEIKAYLLQETVLVRDSVSQASEKGSRASRGSRGSRMSQRLVEQVTEHKMQQADLEEEKRQLEERARIEEQQRELELKTRELEKQKQIMQLDAKLRANRAKLEILERMSTITRQESTAGSRASKSRKSEAVLRQSNAPETGRMQHSTPQIAYDITNNSQGGNLLAERLVDTLERSQRQCIQIEPEVFGGDTLQYQMWKQSFEELVESEVKPKRRLLYLHKYTTGAAKDLIQSVASVNPEEAYKEAMKALEERYGDTFSVYEAYMKRIHEWPAVKVGDTEGLRKYADFLAASEVVMKQVPLLKVLNDPNENIRMLKKLPKGMSSEWSKRVDKWMREERHEEAYPPFSTFVKFVQQKMRIEAGPVQRAMAEYVDGQRSTSTTKGARVMKTEVKESGEGKKTHEEAHVNNVSTKRDRCHYCQNGHLLEVCRKFQALALDERYKQAREMKICRRCLAVGHMARACMDGSTCTSCKKGHHVLFHDPEYQVNREQKYRKDGSQKEQATVSSTQASEEEEAALIVPVLVKDKQGNQEKVYAVIDCQADACFVLDTIADKMGVKKIDVDLELKTMAGVELIATKKIEGLSVSQLDGSEETLLRKTYARDSISATHAQIATPEQVKSWKHLKALHNEWPEIDPNIPIGLLIGRNMTKITKPRDCIPGNDDDPYAVKTILGWGVIGDMEADVNVKKKEKTHAWVHKTAVKEVTPAQVQKMFAMDFHEREEGQSLSVDDKEFLRQLNEKVYIEDGHVYLPLPMKKRAKVPNNKKQALALLEKQKRKFIADEGYWKKYCEFMEEVVDNYSEPADMPAEEGEEWYLSHHGIFHPKKIDQLRVVFHSSLEYKGISLNKCLLKGPDLTNGLIGVLCRFRRKEKALTGDIKKMFYMVKVILGDRDYLRFFWWPNGDYTKEPVCYRMTVHPFGATSSPGCANFALKYIAQKFGSEYAEAAQRFIEEEFYVDDGLTSEDTSEELAAVAQESQELCKKGSFHLHKFLSNDVEVLENIDVKDRAKSLQEVELGKDALPEDHTLGCLWNAQTDTLRFRVVLLLRPNTRRGILATVSSIYDPLELVAPFILKGKRILQDLTVMCKDWDEEVTEAILVRWEQWNNEAPRLEKIEIPRCYTPAGFGSITIRELHHFGDASTSGYGECSYIRSMNTEGKVATALVIAKAHVTPVKMITVPRLELQAATICSKMSVFLKKELKTDIHQQYFYSDSQPVLCYILNEHARYHLYVGNRVSVIRDLTDVKDWTYVDTANNPADLASRGASPEELKDDPLWYKGPSFLREGRYLEKFTPGKIDESDPEIRRSTVLAVAVQEKNAKEIARRLAKLSRWNSIVRATAVLLRLKRRMKNRQASIKGKPGKYEICSVQERKDAELVICRVIQSEDYSEELPDLNEQPQSEVKRKRGDNRGRFQDLDAFIDAQGTIRVGGRLRNADIPYEQKHPVILHGKNILTQRLIRCHHEMVLHCARDPTINSLRKHGYWITSLRHAVDAVIRPCIHCRRYKGRPEVPKMSDLPAERTVQSEPFTVTGVDIFGPYKIKVKRSQEKRYMAMYTCFASRAIHLEVLPSLRADDFLNSYVRLVRRRGPVRELWSDRGTNFVGADNLLKEERKIMKKEIEKMTDDVLKKMLVEVGCDLVYFKFNPPHASHMGGVWERQIRTVRETLASLLDKHQHVMDEDLLRTVACHAEGIVNSLPLTMVDSSRAGTTIPLCPENLLTMKPKVCPPLPGKFDRHDVYAQSRWRRAERIADEIWERWRLEYLQSLQPRQKWKVDARETQPGDIVLIVDEGQPRAFWELAKVLDVKHSKDGRVRSAQVKSAVRTCQRPVSKLIGLIPVEKPVK